MLPADSPAALAWALHLAAGERITVAVSAETGGPQPFLDVFERRPDGGYEPLETAGPGPGVLAIEARREATYVVLVQPQPGTGGRYRVAVRAPAVTVAFPVAGADASAIRSPYGEPRDGGARSHDGVDIFAPRGTPVVSVADAIVDAVQNTGAGGRVIWARDVDGGLLYYYAHLDEQLVAKGTRVAAGDTIGRVGNSGNAGAASPHLHFGIYRPGRVPLDPLTIIGRRTGQPAALPDTAAQGLGARAQTRGTGVRLRTSPSAAARILAELESGTLLKVVGAVGEWRRVVLDDGRAGFIAGRLLQPAVAAQ